MAKQMTIDELSLAITQHADDLQFFANGVSMDALDEFEKTVDAIMELIYLLYEELNKNGLRPSAATTRFLTSLQEKIEHIRNTAFAEEEEIVIKQAREVVKNESKFIKAFYMALTGITAVYAISPKWYDRISRHGVFSGGTIAQIFGAIQTGDYKRIYEAMLDAVRGGMPLDRAREEVRKALRTTRNHLKSAIDSIINGVANDVALAFATENSTMLLFSTALDDKVCEDCMQFEGRFFSPNDDDIPAVPLHYNCRCRLIPVPTNDEKYRQLDFDFKDYYASLTDEEKIDRVGQRKFALARDGEYAIKDYEPPMPEQRMSLAELKARDKSLFGRA